MSSRKSVSGGSKKRKLDPATTEQARSNLKPAMNLLNQGRFTDVTFIVGEAKERIPCHQLFLKFRSSVFEVMFSERWNQDINTEISLPDVEPKAFKMFLQFIYADTFAANVPEALELLQLANKYDVQPLVTKCEKALEGKVTLNSALSVFQAARKYDKIQLMNTVGDLWAKSLQKMQAHPSFAELDKETLMYILKRDDLEMTEIALFRLALQWAGNQRDATVDKSLEDILPLIRFPTMTLNEFSTAVAPTKALPMPTVVELFIYFGTDDEAAKKSLAETLGFSTQKRQPKYSDVYVALYPKGMIPDETKALQQFKTYKESLQFYCQMPGRQIRSQQPTLGIGLSVIRLYCPANGPTRATPGSGRRFRTLKMCLKSKYCGDRDLDLYNDTFYRTLLSGACYEIEEGKQTDIHLDFVIPLKMDRIYCITIERFISAPSSVSMEDDNQIQPMNTVDVNIENIPCTTFTLHRNQLQGFTQDSYPRPHLVCGLTFQAL